MSYRANLSASSGTDAWYSRVTSATVRQKPSSSRIPSVAREGYIKITDRTSDLIKSGGEWISSVDLENGIMSHPLVFEAAVVAVPHEKWQERPVACVVVKEGVEENEETKIAILNELSQTFAKWWLPDEIIFMEELPKTSVGKFLKAALREQLKER